MGNYNTPNDTAELYLPSSGVSCSLPKMPDDRRFHTLEPPSGLLCGGGSTSDTCLKWSPDTGSWKELMHLDVRRSTHVSWTPGTDIGTYLIGGYYSGRTTTLVKQDGTQEPGFTTKYNIQ